MNTDARALALQLYNLLPALYRLRDAEFAEDVGERPLYSLISVIAEQTATVQEGLEQAYDDLFIETCAPWVVPYIGDLIGARPLHGKAPGQSGGRAEVANILGLRRSKGTLAALEKLTRNVTGYPAVAVEYFERLALTEYMNHVRPDNLYTLDLRDELALERLQTPFDRSARTLEVRRIASGRGRHNIPNIGLFLYRIQSYSLTGTTACRVDDFRYTFNPLGIDTPLYNNPEVDADDDFAGPENVPMPITRLAMERGPGAYYGVNASVAISISATGDPVDPSLIVVCNLSDKKDGSGNWAHAPIAHYAIDPVLGRLALPSDTVQFPLPDPANVSVYFRFGFSDDIGGGEYSRAAGIEGAADQTIDASAPDVQSALTAVATGGIVEFADSRTYALASGAPNLAAAPEAVVELRARDGARPVVLVNGGDLVIDGGDNAQITLDGLVLTGGALRITGAPQSVTLRHCTLVPGIARTRQNDPARPEDPVLIIESGSTTVTLDRSICGQIQEANGATVILLHSLIDGNGPERVCFSGGLAAGKTLAGAALKIENSTLIGRVHTRELTRASNVIFVAQGGSGVIPIRSDRTQAGCVRFSAVPPGSRTPRRYRCTTLLPRFTSLRFGLPGYGQLSAACAAEIRAGADDGSEMGVFHDLYQPQRESDLRTRLDEFLRYGMEPGVFYAS